MSRFSLLLCVALAASCAVSAREQPNAGDLALTHVTVVDVQTGTLLRNRTVVIAGDRIAWIAPASTSRIPEGARVIDAGGKYLIPGLWDMHAHTLNDGDTREVLFPLFVAHGVTGIRNTFGDCIAPCPDRRTPIEVLHEWKKDIAAGTLVGPPIVASGAVIDGPNPTHAGSIAVATAEQAREAVRLSKERGADFIKVYAGLRRDAYLAVLEEARLDGLPVSGHVPWSVSVLEAVRAGHRSVEHLHTSIWQHCSADEKELRRERLEPVPRNLGRDSLRALQRSRADRLLATYSEPKCAALFQAYVDHGAWQVPTLSAYPLEAYYTEQAVAREDRLRYIPLWLREIWMAQLASFHENNSAADVVRGTDFRQRNARLVGAMHRAGVGILAGTDAPGPFTFPGSSLHEELELLVHAGLTPLEALRAATLNPARYFGAVDSVGTIAEGRLADLVLLHANPLEDIRHTRRSHAVVVDGVLFDRAGRDALLARVERAAAR